MTSTEFKCWLAIAYAATDYICQLSIDGLRDTPEAVWLRRVWWRPRIA